MPVFKQKSMHLFFWCKGVDIVERLGILQRRARKELIDGWRLNVIRRIIIAFGDVFINHNSFNTTFSIEMVVNMT
jgi:hypothetical protein